jgi:ABC-type branched-subunit amino acid transport system substrate-binding protein
MAVAALGLVACGSSKKSSSSTAAPTTAAAAATTAAGAATTAAAAATTAAGAATTAAGAATTAAAGATTTAAGAATTAAGAATTAASTGGGGTLPTPAAVKATGTPIKVMTIMPVNSPTPPYPNIQKAAEIYGQWINDHGGINGHVLQVETCDGRGDPNEDANCARKAQADGDVAVVGSFSFDFSQAVPILEQDKIALFGSCCPIAQIELSSPISFVLGSNAAVPAGAVTKMVQDGCKKPAVVYIQTAAIDIAITQAKSAFTAAGFDPAKAKFILIPLAAQDYSAQVAQAIDGTDCIYGGISDANWEAFLPAMKSLGGTQRLYGHQGNLNSKVAADFPELTQNGISVNAYPDIAGPMWKDYRQALIDYKAPDLDWNSLAGLGTWAAYQAFNDVVSHMTGDINNVTFLAAANADKAVNTGGMVPVLDLTKPYTGQGGIEPRVFNRSVAYDVIKDAKLTPVDNKLYDMTNVLEGKPA